MKIRRPNEAHSRGYEPRLPVYDRAIAAAIEKSRARSVKLTCDHYTDWDTDQVYSFARPSRDKFWCEQCSKWRAALKVKRQALPEQPLF